MTTSINYLGGLTREFHDVKVLNDGHEDYEPAMFLIRPELMGRSFCIPLGSMWKYLEPEQNRDVQAWDLAEFDKLGHQIYLRRQIAIGQARKALDEDAAAMVFAEALNQGSGILLCTGFSLFKACQILELTVTQQTLCQLLMFIQDGLEELKNRKPAEREDRVEHGEAIIRIDGKTYHVPLESTATDFARSAAEAEG